MMPDPARHEAPTPLEVELATLIIFADNYISGRVEWNDENLAAWKKSVREAKEKMCCPRCGKREWVFGRTTFLCRVCNFPLEAIPDA